MKKVMYVFLICVAMALTVPVSNVNAQLFDEGDIVVSGGIGLGAAYDYNWNAYYSPTLPVLWASGDYCLREDLGPGNLGIGAIMALGSYKYEVLNDTEKYFRFLLGARGTYHFVDLVDNLDLYGGISLGLKLGDTYYDPDPFDYVMEEIFVGARYFFADNIAVNGELGYGVAYAKAGISFKF